jgi:biopolymer transport protein ExbB
MELLIIGVLGLASILGLTIIIERGFALRQKKVMPSAILGAMEACRSEGDLPLFRGICTDNPSPLGRLLLFADSHRKGTKSETVSALETRARHEIAHLERGLVILEIVVGVAPLLGLVGTIYGLITLFAGMGDVSTGSVNNMANGISVALNATLVGLLTAIPSLVAWSYYTKKVDTYAIEMATLCEEFLRRQFIRVAPPADDKQPAARR